MHAPPIKQRLPPADMPPAQQDAGVLGALPADLQDLVLGRVDAQSILRLRTVNKSARNVVRNWGNRQVERLVNNTPTYMERAPLQPALPYPDVRETQRRIAVAATASPDVASVQTTLGEGSSAAANIPFTQGGGFTFRTAPQAPGGPFHEVEAHPGGGQHSGGRKATATREATPAIPTTPQFGGAYIRTGVVKNAAQKHAKGARRFGMFGEFEHDQDFWVPLGNPPRESYVPGEITTHSTGSLIRTGATSTDAEQRAALHAELLRRFRERQNPPAKKE